MIVAVAGAALVGCGTTVTTGASGQGAVAGSGLDGTGTDTVGAVPGTGTSAGADVPTSGELPVDGSSGPAGPAGSAPVAGTTVGPASSGRTATARGPRGSAVGVTPTTITLGIYTVQGFSDAVGAAGVNIATGNQARQARTVIAHLNARGGIAGRKIVPVFHDFDVAKAATDVNSEYQSACETFTQDNKVYAVATVVGTFNDTFYACTAKAGVISSAVADTKDAEFFRRYHDTFYMPSEINTTRIMANSVRPLKDAGFFGSAPKIGVVRTDTIGDQRAVDQGLKPALAAVGLRLDKEFAAPITGDSSSAYSAAVLQFKAAGITHVLFTPLGSPIAFSGVAESQNYRPLYGLNSRNGPASILQGAMSPSQLHGAMGYGWQPTNDVDGAHDPGPVSNRAKQCHAMMRAAGEDTTQRSIASVALWICDAIFVLRDALAQAPDFSLAGFRTGAERLTRYEAASTFRSGFAPGKLHDAANGYRLFAFKDDCTCFTYTTPVRAAA